MSEINKAGYNKWAETYDTDENSTVYVDEIYFPPHFQHLPQGNVLEVGCGTGRHTIKLASAGHKVTAIDLSESMLQIATKRLINYNCVEFLCGDFLNRDFIAASNIAPNSFDLAIMALVLEHIARPFDAFMIIADLLAPNGILLISDIHQKRMKNGSGARFIDRVTNEETRLQSFTHEPKDLMAAAVQAGLELFQHSTVYGTSDLGEIAPNWSKYKSQPMINIWGFRKLGYGS